MAKSHYQFKKRQKELARLKKKEEKRKLKQEKKKEDTGDGENLRQGDGEKGGHREEWDTDLHG